MKILGQSTDMGFSEMGGGGRSMFSLCSFRSTLKAFLVSPSRMVPPATIHSLPCLPIQDGDPTMIQSLPCLPIQDGAPRHDPFPSLSTHPRWCPLHVPFPSCASVPICASLCGHRYIFICFLALSLVSPTTISVLEGRDFVHGCIHSS